MTRNTAKHARGLAAKYQWSVYAALLRDAEHRQTRTWFGGKTPVGAIMPAAHSTTTRMRSGFTLIEALLSTAVLAIAGSAVLVGVASTLQTSDLILEQTIAAGMAGQLMNEIAGGSYCEPGGNPYAAMQTEAGENAGPGRSGFDDLDDYNGLVEQPPRDRWGVALGVDDGLGGERHAGFQAWSNYFGRWRQTIEVYYVSDADMYTRLPAGNTSDYRAVEVRILEDDPVVEERELARVTRVFANVPTP